MKNGHVVVHSAIVFFESKWIVHTYIYSKKICDFASVFKGTVNWKILYE